MPNFLELECRTPRTLEHDDPLMRLLRFYEANHYTLDDPRQSAAQPIVELDMTRGKAGAGWMTSDMTRLHSKVSLRLEDDEVLITYKVDTTGQVLKEQDRLFWAQELEAAQDFLKSAEDQEPADLTLQESSRAQDIRKGSLSLGLKVGIGVGMLIFLSVYIAHNLRLI